MDQINTYDEIFNTVLHHYMYEDVELNLLHFEFPVHAKKVELLKIYRDLKKNLEKKRLSQDISIGTMENE